MARVNILKQVKTPTGWRNVALRRDARNRIKWTSAGRYIIEWREDGRRQRQAAGVTPAEAVETQKQKVLELSARASGLKIEEEHVESETMIPLKAAIADFIKDIRTFRKPMTT
jgi:hypothetical protein